MTLPLFMCQRVYVIPTGHLTAPPLDGPYSTQTRTTKVQQNPSISFRFFISKSLHLQGCDCLIYVLLSHSTVVGKVNDEWFGLCKFLPCGYMRILLRIG